MELDINDMKKDKKSKENTKVSIQLTQEERQFIEKYNLSPTKIFRAGLTQIMQVKD